MALIGSIAINMSVRTAQLVKDMQKASKVVAEFGSNASIAVARFGAVFGQAGTTVASTINQKFIPPILKAAAVVEGLGRSIARVAKGPMQKIGRIGGLIGEGAGVVGHIGGVIGEGAGVVAKPMLRATKLMGSGLLQVGLFGGRTMMGLSKATLGFAKRVDGAVSSIVNMKNALVFGVIGAGLYKMTKLASELGEQMNRTEVMFGNSTKKITARAELMATAFGTSRNEFLRSTAAMGGMVQAMGYTKDQSADLAIHFQQMAQDLASLVDIPVAEAMSNIESAMSGEVKPMRDLGVFLSEAATKSQAAKDGIAKLGTELTEQQKFMARGAFLTENLKYAQGDMAKTADSAANAARALMGRLENLAQTIGAGLLPLVAPVMVEMQQGIEGMRVMWTESAEEMANSTNKVGGAMETANTTAGVFQTTVGWLAWGFQKLRIAFLAVRNIITRAIGGWIKLSAAFGKGISWIIEKTTGRKTDVSLLTNMAEEMERAVDKEDKIFKEAWNAEDWSKITDKAFQKGQDKIRQAREDAKKSIKSLKEIGAPKMEAVEAGTPKLASAAVMGTQAAAEVLLRSRYGEGAAGKDAGKLTAENTKQLVIQGVKMLGMFQKLTGNPNAGLTNVFGNALDRAMAGGF